MVYYRFMDKFNALADPTRRNIIEMLASHGQLSATEICDKFSVSPQAISQHLKILRETNFVRVEKRAQQRIYQINPYAMVEVEEWAKQYRQIWSERFEDLDKVLKAQSEVILKNQIEEDEETDGKN
jgi:DNA-binding transcriptional ArsR family regulator